MNTGRSSPFLLVLLAVPVHALAADFFLVRDGHAQASVYAPGENQWAGDRLVRRVAEWTGARIGFKVSASLPRNAARLVAVGTPSDNPVVAAVLGDDPRLAELGDEGYILKASAWEGRPVLLVTGATLTGVHNAIGELVSWELRLGDDDAWVSADLDKSDRPALKYRLLWNWTMRTVWASSVPEMHEYYTLHKRNDSPAYAEAKVGMLVHLKRVIDFASDHKINGLIVWHWLHDHHGGVEAGQELSRYARRRNVRLLPGIGTACYGGFYSAGRSPYSLAHRMAHHPELRRFVDADDTTKEMPCSSDPEHRRWLVEGTRWFFETFPDVGGANLEQGDFQACQCDLCRDARAKHENDPNCFYDMMVTEKPVIETARRVRPDAWMIFATYIGFREDRIVAAMNGLIKSGSGRADGVVFPPRFLKQYPQNSICQWTVSHMVTPRAWPQGAKPPEGNFKDHIGLLHEGSGWDRNRWWARAGPQRGSGLNDASEVVQFVCRRMQDAGMAGLVIYGEIGAVSPANELNYVAMEYFTWHPERTWAQFLQDRLTLCYGNVERARLFLKLLRNTTRDPAEIEQDRRLAAQTGTEVDLDARQRARWRNLAGELNRRLILARQMENQEESR